MAAAIAAAAIFLLLVSAISFLGYRKYVRPAGVYEQIGGTSAQVISASLGDGEPQQGSWAVRVLRTVGEKVPASPADAGIARRHLMAAGYRSDTALPVYYGIKLVCCL